MLEYELPGVWHIEHARASTRMVFGGNRSWSLSGTGGPSMSGTWSTTSQGIDLTVTRLGSVAGRGLAILGGGIVAGMTFGLATPVVLAALGGIMASNAAKDNSPGALAQVGHTDVWSGRAVVHYRLMSCTSSQIRFQNTYPQNTVDVVLNRIS